LLASKRRVFTAIFIFSELVVRWQIWAIKMPPRYGHGGSISEVYNRLRL
jgi:hypothetical protein